MSFITKRYPSDPYERPAIPHHVHLDPTCSDHSEGKCPEEHWYGGRPEKDWPHHVEIDISTGLVGYTRLSEEEKSDLELCWAHEEDLREKGIIP